MVLQPDGKIIIAGDFTTLAPNGGPAVTRNRIARLNPDGTLDTAFNPNANNTIYAIALQADGKVLVSGDFNGVGSIGGQTRNYIARLDATSGAADSSFDANADGIVTAIVLPSEDKILVVSPSRARVTARFSWAAFSTGRIVSALKRAITSPGLIPRPACRIRSIPTQMTMCVPSSYRRTARSWRVVPAGPVHRAGERQGPGQRHRRRRSLFSPVREASSLLPVDRPCALQAERVQIFRGGR